ncbi:hypothetical protein FRC03_001306 [Tulasnella sp. 419]|nr:hypothetical protein FRC03_001306 [Tulasnella sp. 419]
MPTHPISSYSNLYHPKCSRRRLAPSSIALAIWLLGVANAQYVPEARWGQASALLGNTLYVHGGKVDPFNSYSYTSAPNTNEVLSLDLSSAFDISNPPWNFVAGAADPSTCQGPAVAFHSLTAYDDSHLLSFGGEGGPTMPIQTNSDSTWVFDATIPFWRNEQANGEPQRRTFHSAAASNSGQVWITGGQKADGSAIGFRDTYIFQPSDYSFSTLGTTGDSDLPALVGHGSIMLPSGLLVVIGGYSSDTDNLTPFSMIWLLDTMSPNPTWINITAQGATPHPRRNFAMASLDDNKILIHGGGDAVMQSVYDDGAILDLSVTPANWVAVPELADGLGPRSDHMAIGLGNYVLFGFGRTLNGPGPSSLAYFDTISSSFSPAFIPRSSSSGPSIIPTATSAGIVTRPVTGTMPPASSLPTSRTGLLPGQSLSVSGSMPTPSPTQTNGSQPDSSNNDSKKKVAIILSTLFAVLGLAGLLLGVLVFIGRRAGRRGFFCFGHRDSGQRKLASAATDPEMVGLDGEKIPIAATHWPEPSNSPHTLLGIIPVPAFLRRDHHMSEDRIRFDMLSDEDGRSFGHVGGPSVATTASGTGFMRPRYERLNSLNSLGAEGKKLIGGAWNASATSLRAVGNALGIGPSGRQGASEHGDQTAEWWEKTPDPFADHTALLPNAPGVTAVGMMGTAARPRGGHYQSSSLSSSVYRDPFVDGPGHIRGPSSGSESYTGVPVMEPTHKVSYSWKESIQPRMVPPPTPSTLSIDGTHEGTAVLSVLSTPTIPSPEITRPTSPLTDHQTGTLASASSIIAAAPTTSVKRSDSWWNRFSRSSLGDRDGRGPMRRLSLRNNASSPTEQHLDFRDPNPPPKLEPLVETGATPETSPESTIAGPNDKLKLETGLAKYGSHSKSMSSVRTNKTANSDALQQIAGGRVDIVQRIRTGSRDSTPTSSMILDDNGDHGRLPSSASILDLPEAVSPIGEVDEEGSKDSHGSGRSRSKPISAPLRLVGSPPSSASPGTPTTESFATAVTSQTRPGVNHQSSSNDSFKTAGTNVTPPALQSPRAVPNRPSLRRPAGSPGVAARIAAFEKRASQEVTPPQPAAGPSSPRKFTVTTAWRNPSNEPTSPTKRSALLSPTQSPPLSPTQDTTTPGIVRPRSGSKSNDGNQPKSSKKKGDITWGLAERSELFVANPDRRSGSGSTVDDSPR